VEKMAEQHEQQIYIVGHNSFQNEIMSDFIYYALGVKCISERTINSFQNIKNGNIDHNILIMFDTDCDDTNKVVEQLEEKNNKDVISNFPTALFNMIHGTSLEAEALRCGVKGFFYTNDTKELFLKGLHAIFEGQLWVSRDVLARCILDDTDNSIGNQISSLTNGKSGNNDLTRRELEIIAMITVGAKNDEIADKLCISPHTVKTHLYNVFKKINVADRLQAALWAAKNL
jgi:LuxR family transcriptional regulator of csgAB operon